MDDKGLNRWLEINYGTTIEGLPLFKLVWSAGLTEVRRGTFRDYYGEIIIREVTETRTCLKYPFAPNRWVVEKICPTPEHILNTELFTKYTYEGIYIFEDAKKKPLPLEQDKLETVIWAYLQFGRIKPKDRYDMRMNILAEKEKVKKEKIRQIVGAGMRSPYFFVRE